MKHLDTSADQCVRDEVPVATPWDCFGAHQRQRLPCGKDAREAGSELGGKHVVGVRAEGFVAPAKVLRVRKGLSTAAQLGDMDVVDPFRGNGPRESLAREMRMSTGAREAPDVGERRDVEGAEDAQELLDGSRGVAHCVNRAAAGRIEFFVSQLCLPSVR